ncbi:unnamed protein product [Ceutorhynchus assimilis]|uniref:Endonuclease/exonuclease/phosphatase domain-containing protein n=1 Tax=Ceutorhynchus assimilis TaxID=467358 RepID=A0A9N9MKB0_9CUCU|nr:unnamed protein product [Ceutorhynchus assimilis]
MKSGKNRALLHERKLRKNNIIVFGIPRCSDILNNTISALNNLLGVDIKVDDINNITQLGNTANSPILIEFISFLKKSSLFGHVSKLKGTKISIANDLCPEDRENHRILVKYLKEAKGRNLNAKIKGNKLVIDDTAYSIEDLEAMPESEAEISDSETIGTGNNLLSQAAGNQSSPEQTVKKRKRVKIIPGQEQEFKSTVHNKYDIISVSETWLSAGILDELIYLKGYKLYRRDRTSGRGGGVAVYVRSKFKSKIFALNKACGSEQLWIVVKYLNCQFGIGTLHRPPKCSAADFVVELENELGAIDPTCNSLILMGDLNIDLLDLNNCESCSRELSDAFIEWDNTVDDSTSPFSSPSDSIPNVSDRRSNLNYSQIPRDSSSETEYAQSLSEDSDKKLPDDSGKWSGNLRETVRN